MRRAPLYLSTICLLLPALSCLTAQDQINWLTDLRQARQAAEQQRRFVLLHFWSDSCAPCRELEHNVFNQPELIRALSTHFVPVKINVLQQQKLAEYYKIDRVPTDIIVDPQGRELHRQTSPAHPNAYLAMLDQIRAEPSVTLASNPGIGTRPSAPTSLLPPREGSESVARSEPINTDPRSWNGSGDASRRDGLPGTPATPQRTLVQNEFAAANNTPASATAETAARYGNPYLPPNASSSAPGLSPAPQPLAKPNFEAPHSPASSAPGPGSPSPAFPAPGLAGSNPAAPGSSTPLPAGQPGVPDPAYSGAPTNVGTTHQGAKDPGHAVLPDLPPPSPSAPGDGGPVPSGGGVPAGNAAPSAPVANLPPNLPPLAIEGYCPVTLVAMQKWVRGDVRWGAVHRGRTYLLASQADQQRFLSDPDRFSPALSGYDPVRFAESRQLVDGRREFGVFFAGTYYLFADEAALVKFESQPNGYVMVVRQAMASTSPGAQR